MFRQRHKEDEPVIGFTAPLDESYVIEEGEVTIQDGCIIEKMLSE